MEDKQQAALKHFSNIPWCAKLVENPAYQHTHAESRKLKASGEDALFAETFQTEATIPHCLFLLCRPSGPSQPIEELLMLVQLERKINGHPTTAHGGAQAFLLDEAMAKLLSVNKDLTTKPGDEGRPTTVTKSLSVGFVRPVTTPCAVLATARFKGPQDRGSRRSTIVAELTDGEGTVLTQGEAVFVRLREGSGARM